MGAGWEVWVELVHATREMVAGKHDRCDFTGLDVVTTSASEEGRAGTTTDRCLLAGCLVYRVACGSTK